MRVCVRTRVCVGDWERERGHGKTERERWGMERLGEREGGTGGGEGGRERERGGEETEGDRARRREEEKGGREGFDAIVIVQFPSRYEWTQSSLIAMCKDIPTFVKLHPPHHCQGLVY